MAVELERSAGRAQARSGLAAAAALLQRAVALTASPERRADRALAAAQASLEAGAFETALGLVAAAEVGPLDELQRARVDLLRGQVAFAPGAVSDAPPLLLRAAKTLEPLDLKLARETYLDAWSAALFAGRLASPAAYHEVSREAATAPRRGRTLRAPPICCWTGWPCCSPRDARRRRRCWRGAVGFAGDEVSVEERLRWGWLATSPPQRCWDYETCVRLPLAEPSSPVSAGALSALLAGTASTSGPTSHWAESSRKRDSMVAEADAVAEATGARFAPTVPFFSPVLQGREARPSS